MKMSPASNLLVRNDAIIDLESKMIARQDFTLWSYTVIKLIYDNFPLIILIFYVVMYIVTVTYLYYLGVMNF